MSRPDLEGRLPIVYNGKPVEEWYSMFCEMSAKVIDLQETLERMTHEPLLLERDVREAFDPVASWFDVDGEEDFPMPMVEAIKEAATMLAEERKENLAMRATLRKLYKEMELSWNRAYPTRDEVHRWGQMVNEHLKEST